MNPSSLCCGQHYYFDLETKATVQHQPDKSIGLSPTDSVNEFESGEMGVKWHCSHSNSPHSNDVWKREERLERPFLCILSPHEHGRRSTSTRELHVGLLATLHRCNPATTLEGTRCQRHCGLTRILMGRGTISCTPSHHLDEGRAL
jgi:hypothetical protein